MSTPGDNAIQVGRTTTTTRAPGELRTQNGRRSTTRSAPAAGIASTEMRHLMTTALNTDRPQYIPASDRHDVNGKMRLLGSNF